MERHSVGAILTKVNVIPCEPIADFHTEFHLSSMSSE